MAVSRFGEAAMRKLGNTAATGQPEDQLRAPLEALLEDLASLAGIRRGQFAAVGESSLSDLKTRPDYAISIRNALVGFIEVKAPGKGADPTRFRDPHDREQWARLKAIPNLVYTDGNEFGLYRDGERVGGIVRLNGDVASSGRGLTAPPALRALVEDFVRWQPVPPRTVKQLAITTARLCRLLRDEVTEQMERGSTGLTALATDWRRLLFPDASDARFADGYAQAVTFGLLVARARGIPLADGLSTVAHKLGHTDSLIGTALKLLTDSEDNERALQTSMGTLVRVLDVVVWKAISKGSPDAWLYFYEDFLEVYDNKLRKQTGSYYTPPQVVDAMVRLVDDALRTRFDLPTGFASANVTVADPAMGTGTFLLGVLRRIAAQVEGDQGPGAVSGAIDAAIRRLIAFELQLGPFAVAQLRVVAELTALCGTPPTEPLRMYVTDTLANPYVEVEYMSAMLQPIAESRRSANRIKREEKITVVIGNPPYKEKARGLGGWVEAGASGAAEAPLNLWKPPREWGVGPHVRHLRNLYVYFWRWATWKVFDQKPEDSNGVVSFITASGFLNGPGFEKMRDYLRRTADEIWIINCSPEGHQPEVSTRIFGGVQQPVCIMIVARAGRTDGETAAAVHYRALPEGRREEKFAALAHLTLGQTGWVNCPTGWRSPFLPEASGSWVSYPALDDFFEYNGSGVMLGRTWVIAPDAGSLEQRWDRLIHARDDAKEGLFQPHLRRGEPGDRHVHKVVKSALGPRAVRPVMVADDSGPVEPPVRYGFRSFDRQWIIPDNRLINQPNPTLWEWHSERQVYLTAPSDLAPTAGPSLSLTSLVPDVHHYNGRGGRTFPLWKDAAASVCNIRQGVLAALVERLGHQVTGEDVLAYIAAVAAHPAYVARFKSELRQPGLRIPLTTDAVLFAKSVAVGREIVWLHTFGERCVDAAAGRPHRAPRLVGAESPRISASGAIPSTPDGMPEDIDYDAGSRTLRVGAGRIENVSQQVWEYEVSGKQVIKQWFSYRRKNRDRPIMGDRRAPSPLGDIQTDHWLAEYTTELFDLIHVLDRLVALEPAQTALLERICSGPLITATDLSAVHPEVAAPRTRKLRRAGRMVDQHQTDLLK